VSRITFVIVLIAAVVVPAPGVEGQAAPAERPRPDSLRLFYDQIVLAAVGEARPTVIHPVFLALQKAHTLGLSRDQLDGLLDLGEEIERAFIGFATSTSDDVLRPSIWWEDEPVDEAALRATSLQAAEKQVEAVLQLLQLRDQVFEILSEEQKTQLLGTHWEKIDRYRQEAKQRPMRPCIQGGSGGGGILSDRAQIVWSVTFEQDSARIDGLFVARVEDRLRHGVPPRPRPDVPALSGGSAGVWILLFDRETRTAYVHERPVELRNDNVVLVNGIDRLHDLPDVAGTMFIPARFHTGGCLDGEDWVDALRDHVLSVPEIREFIGN
jgi:hypothetical protein